MPIDLVIDTSTDALICGLVSYESRTRSLGEAAVVRQEKMIPTSRDHMELLIPLVQELMQAEQITHTELDSMIVGIGPGPFTGLRVGIASALALAQAWNKPLFSAISLEALAQGVVSEKSKYSADLQYDELVVLLDARRKEWYAARYRIRDNSIECCTPPYAARPEQIDWSQATIICPQKIAEQLADYHPLIRDHPKCIDLWSVAVGDGSWDTIHPIYCRQPDAVPSQRIKKVVP